MNEIKICLKPSGSTAELYKDFNLYQGSYRNVQISIYVPTSILYKNADNTFFNTVQTGAIITAPNGAKVPTLGYNAAFVRTVTVNNVEYAEYTQVMPKEYALYAGTQIIVCNVINIDNTNESSPKIISVTTTQRAQLIVLESAYLSTDEPLEPSEADVIEGLINNLQNLLLKGYYASRAMYAWSSEYTYGANELVFYPDEGDYGVFLKSLVDNNNTPPYSKGNLNTERWLLVSDFNILAELYNLKGDIESAVQLSSANAESAGQSASEAANASQNATQGAMNAEASAERIESQAQYIEGVKDGTIAVAKAVADGTGENIENQFKSVVSDIQGLRDDINNESHFRGMFDSVEALREAYPTATPNDYAYIVGGNQWIYQDGAWNDSNVPSPNTSVPKGTAIPLMDGVGSAGSSSAYSPEDHRHPSDTTKADTSGNYPDMTVGTAYKITIAQCRSSADAVSKTVDQIENYSLITGARITVKFWSANTANSPTLNVNNTGAKPIIADGDTIYVKWLAGAVMDFVYDGTYWVCVGGYQLQGMRVGSLYFSHNQNPANIYGGSWASIEGRTILGHGKSSENPLYKGIYSSSTQYYANDVVFQFSDALYWVCKKDVKGIAPSESNDEYWVRYDIGYEGGSADAVVVEHGNHIGDLNIGTPTDNSYFLNLYNLARDGYAAIHSTNRPFSLVMGNEAGFNTFNHGESGVGKNMPLYHTAYIWYRTA